MCDKRDDPRTSAYNPYAGQSMDNSPVANVAESHAVYELKHKRDRLLRQLLAVQQAIDAVNSAF